MLEEREEEGQTPTSEELDVEAPNEGATGEEPAE